MIIFAFGLIHQAEVAAWSDTSFILEDSVSVVLLSACRGQLFSIFLSLQVSVWRWRVFCFLTHGRVRR